MANNTLLAREKRETSNPTYRCPLSYDQARCMHPPFVECDAIQAFSIASDFDTNLIPKAQNQITMRNVSSSYIPVVQITILAAARIARDTTQFSL